MPKSNSRSIKVVWFDKTERVELENELGDKVPVPVPMITKKGCSAADVVSCCFREAADAVEWHAKANPGTPIHAIICLRHDQYNSYGICVSHEPLDKPDGWLENLWEEILTGGKNKKKKTKTK